MRDLHHIERFEGEEEGEYVCLSLRWRIWEEMSFGGVEEEKTCARACACA